MSNTELTENQHYWSLNGNFEALQRIQSKLQSGEFTSPTALNDFLVSNMKLINELMTKFENHSEVKNKQSEDVKQARNGALLKDYKGDHYSVIGRGTHTKSNEELLICEKNSDKSILIQPLDSFSESVEHNGEIVSRFEIVPTGPYGGIRTRMINLEVGTKFYVHNGVWQGEIILINDEKRILIEGDRVENAIEISNDKTFDISIIDSFK